MGNRESAFTELQRAEHDNQDADPGVDQIVAETFQSLDEPLKAVQYYTRFLRRANERSIEMESVKEAQQALNVLRLRMTQTPVDYPLPRMYTIEEVRKTLRARLTERELGLIVNPLFCSQAMKKWADDVVRVSANPDDIAKNILQRLTKNIKVGEFPMRQTAEEAFKKWRDLNMIMNCQDASFLYVALARAAGLRCHFAYVTSDYNDRPVSHICAVVSIRGTNVLADPAYDWLGVPHKQFTLKDDIDIIGAFMAESDETDKEDVGLKIVPDWAEPHFWAALNRIRRGDCNGALVPLKAGRNLSPDGWLGLYAQATLDMCDGALKSAVTNLRTCLTLNSDWALAHFSLATILERQGVLGAARDEYRAYLAARSDPGLVQQANKAISYIDEKLDDQANKYIR